MRILLVDDHPVVRQGIKLILTGTWEHAEVGEAGDRERALALIQAANWDLVMLDVSMPGGGGLEILKELRRERPKLPVLVLSIHPPDHYARRMVSAGASAYLTKDSPPAELISAIRHLLAGRRYFSPQVMEELALGYAPDPTAGPHGELSDREFQVLRMLGAGRSVSKIAADLELSVKTVSTYRARVLKKMGMRTTADLMRYVIQNALEDLIRPAPPDLRLYPAPGRSTPYAL